MSKILNNIWQQLSDDGHTQSDFETWESNFNESPDVKSNVYNYLKENKLTENTQVDFLKNIKIDKKETKVKNILTEKYGTVDRDEIFTQVFGDDLYAEFNPNNLAADPKAGLDLVKDTPWFEDGDVNEYLYKDILMEGTKDLVSRFGFWTGIMDEDEVITKQARYDFEGGEDLLKHNILSSFVNKSGAFKLLAQKNAIPQKEEYIKKHVDPIKRTKTISDFFSQNLTIEDQEIRGLYEQGKWDKAVEKSKKQGYVLLYNKDGKSVNWDSLTVEEKQNVNPNDVALVDAETEEAANNIAETMSLSDREVAINEREQLTYELLGIMKVIQKNAGKNTARTNIDKATGLPLPPGRTRAVPAGAAFGLDITGGRGYVLDDILNSAENNELIGRLKPLAEDNYWGPQKHGEVGDVPLILQYNKTLKDINTINRAIEINTDLSLLPEEIIPGVRFSDSAGLTNDEYEEQFENVWNQMGYEKNEQGEKLVREDYTWHPLKGRSVSVFGEELSTRDIAEGVVDFGANIAPLIASIYITKRLPLGTMKTVQKYSTTFKAAKTTRTVGSEITRRGKIMEKILINGSKSPTRRRLTKLFVGGVTETAVLSAADQINQRIFQQDGMVFDNKTGAFTPEFAFGLGVGNAFAGMFMKKLYTTALGTRILNVVKKSKGKDGMRLEARRFGNITEKALITAPIAATGGVFSMEVAKVFSGQSELVDLAFQDIDYSQFRQEGFETEQEYRDYKEKENNNIKHDLVKHIISDGLAMYFMGMMGQGGIKDAWQKDVENYSIATKRTSKASKNLSKESGVEIKEGNNLNKINEAERKAKKKIEEDYELLSKKTPKDKKLRDKRLEEVKESASTMKLRLDLIEAKKAIKKQKKIDKNLEDKVTLIENQIKITGKIGGQQVIDMANMTDAQVKYLVAKTGAKSLEARMPLYKTVVDAANSYKSLSTVSKAERNRIIEKALEVAEKGSELKALELKRKTSGGLGVYDNQIAKLKEQVDVLNEKFKFDVEALETKYKEAVARELLVAKKIAESLGAEFEIATSEADYIAKGGKKGTAGEYSRKNGKIIVNPEFAVKMKTIGTGIHEVVHHILKDAFKEPDPNNPGETRISKEGVAIIDQFLNTISKEARGVIYKGLNESYRKKDKKIQLKNETYEQKSKYYEEVLTKYVEGLKNETIKLDKTNGQKIQDVFLPYINKVFPNIGKKTIEYSTKDANGLKNMLENIFSESERLGGVSKYEIAEFIKKMPKKVEKSYEAFSDKKFSKFPEMDRINEVGEKYTKEEWKNGKWEEGFNEILPDIIKILTKKSAEANAKLPGIINNPELFAYEVAQQMGGLLEGQRAEGGHVARFDISKKEYKGGFGLSGWINGVANNRVLTVLKKADKVINKDTRSLDLESAKDIVDSAPNVIDVIDRKISDESSKRILAESDKPRLHEKITELNRGKGEKAKEIHNGVKSQFIKNGKVDVKKLKAFGEGKNIKSIPRLALPETVGFFVESLVVKMKNKDGSVKTVIGDKALAKKIANKIEKKSNLDQTDIIFLQKGLDKLIPLFADFVVPEGFITKEVTFKDKATTEKATMQVPGQATGVPNKIKAVTHNKRSIAGETTITGQVVRSNENFTGFYKKPIDSKVIEDIYEAIGIMKDGSRNTNSRNNYPVKGMEGVGETLKGVVSLFEKQFTSQPTRELMLEQGLPFEAMMLSIADGKPPKAFNMGTEQLNLLELSFKVEPVKLSEFIGKAKRAYENLNEAGLEKFKDENGREVIEAFEDVLFTPETKGESTNYTKDIIKGKTPAHTFVKNNMASPGGVMLDGYKLIERNAEGVRFITKTGDKFIKETTKSVANTHPALLIGNWSDKLGMKGKTWDKRTMPKVYKGIDVRNTKNILSEQQKLEIEKDFLDIGINIDAISDATDMVYSKQAALLKPVLKGRGSRAEKLKLLDTKKIGIANEGNVNHHKAIIETKRKHVNENIVSVEQPFYENRLMTSNVTSKRALSTFGMIYVVDGKQIADAYGTSKQMSHTSKGDFKGTTQKYYDSKPYREYIKDWKESAEWTERYNENLKDPNLKANAEKNKIKPETQAEKQTIEDLVPFNEHINGNGNAMVEGLGYIYSNGKGGKKALDAIARDHSTAWVPNYIGKKTLDVAGPSVSKKGYARLTAYLPAAKLNNIYTYDGKKATEFIAETQKVKEIVERLDKSTTANVGRAINKVLNSKYSKLTGRDVIKDLMTVSKARGLGRLSKKKARGMSTFDFDETVGVSENFIFATKGKETKKIASNEWPFVGDKLLSEGWKMDFTDFNKVTGGKPGPLMQKLKNQIKKYGPENVFILTARAPESQKAIYDYLKSEGVKIPIKNITGLGNSTGEAKAMWMLEKFSEGYNDMYFVDDAMPNVKAVKEVLDQLDIKSSVQIARQFNKGKLGKDFNKIIQDIYNIGAGKEYSAAKGKLLGKSKRTKSLITPANQDFAGLLQNFIGKSKLGEKHQEFFNEALHKPFARAYNNINTFQQNTVDSFKALTKNFPVIKKNLAKKIPGSPWTFDHAVRVHRWTKAGFKIPDLSKTDVKELNAVVEADAKLLAFSEKLAQLTKQEKGYTKPGANWLSGSIISDLSNVVSKVNRTKELAEFIENRESIFGTWNNGRLEGPNMNKIEVTQGPKFREALEDILWRMETGSNRPAGKNAVTNAHMDFINGAVGTTMFLNSRSALLQGLSTFNYVNWKDNNPIAAGKAFANTPQYWKDFKYIITSDMLRQRRGGLKYNVQEAELAQSAAQGKENWRKGDIMGIAKSTIAYMLKVGFLPTQVMDSFAISAGGATFYRNRINTYLKQGLKQKAAEKQAWLDFQETTEVAQQSSRPDLISQNQAAPTGRLVLAWANTPMQYGRIQEKSVRSFINRRGSDVESLSKIAYYGAIQSSIFAALQNALFAYALDEEDDMASGDPQIPVQKRSDDALYKRTFRTVNTIIDGQLGGIGIPGKVVSTVKNMALEFHAQDKKEYNKDFSRVGIQAISYSPPIGSKIRAIVGAGNIWRWNKDAIVGSPMNLDNPGLMAMAKIIEATTNAPVARALQKIDNLREAADQRNQYWQRVSSFFGFASWDIGVKNEEFEKTKKKFKKLRKKSNKKKKKKIYQTL